MDDLVKRVVRVKVCAVWDTVSALGLPTPHLSPRPLAFVGKTVPGVLDNAFQALALNESRRHFRPRVWRGKEHETTNVKQCWFLGSHADVGGGNRDSGLASLSFLWMIAQLEEHTKASFDKEALLGFLTPVYFQWEQSLNRNLGTYSENLKVDSHTSTHGRYFRILIPLQLDHQSANFKSLTGQAKKAGWFWWFTGVQLRRKHLKVPTKPTQEESGGEITEAPSPAEAVLEGLEEQDTAISPRGFPTPPPDVHFTVRLMVSKKRNKCHVLRHWQTVVLPGGEVVWTRFPLDESGNAKVEKPKQPYQRKLLEDQWTVYERKVLAQWFRREDDIASLRAESDVEDDSINCVERKDQPLHLFLRSIVRVEEDGEEQETYNEEPGNGEKAEVAHEKHPAVGLMYHHSGFIVTNHYSEMKHGVKAAVKQRKTQKNPGPKRRERVRAFRASAKTKITLSGQFHRYRETSMVDSNSTDSPSN